MDEAGFYLIIPLVRENLHVLQALWLNGLRFGKKKNTNIFVAVLELSGVKSSTWSISKKSIFGLKMSLEDKNPSEKVNQQDYFGNI